MKYVIRFFIVLLAFSACEQPVAKAPLIPLEDFFRNPENPGTSYEVRVRTRIAGVWVATTPSITVTTPGGSKSMPIDNYLSGNNVVPTDLRVYPNPASDYTNLSFRLEEGTDVQVNIFDVRGALVKSERLNNMRGETTLRIDLGGFSKGLYIVRVTSPGFVENLKIVVQ